MTVGTHEHGSTSQESPTTSQDRGTRRHSPRENTSSCVGKRSSSFATEDALAENLISELHDGEDRWDCLDDQYYTMEERNLLADLVREEKAQMLAEINSADEVIRFHKSTNEKCLGSGTFGSVYCAIDDDTGEILAVKEVSRANAHQSKSISALQQEMKTLRRLRHQNIVLYKGVLVEEDKVTLIMEHCEGGSISSVLASFGALEDAVVRRYVAQILTGLDYLHRHCIVHRDIKCANCLLGAGGVVKLADFGASKHLRDTTGSIQGTVIYMAPEVMKGRLGRQADIWSVGCSVVEMYDASMPFEGQFSNDMALMYRLSKVKHPPKPPENLPDDAKSFVQLCFTFVPEKRPNARWLLSEHPFTKGQQLPVSAPSFLSSRSMSVASANSHSSRDGSHASTEIPRSGSSIGDITPQPRQVSPVSPRPASPQRLQLFKGKSPNSSAVSVPSVDELDHQASLDELLRHSSERNFQVTSPIPLPTTRLRGSWGGTATASMMKSQTFDVSERPHSEFSVPVDEAANRKVFLQGRLWERFCDPLIEKQYKLNWRRSATHTVRTSRNVLIFGFTFFAIEELSLRFNRTYGRLSAWDEVRFITRCIFWTLVAAIRYLPLPNNEATWQVVRHLGDFSSVLTIVFQWGQHETASVFRLLYLTFLGSILLSVKTHMASVFLYSVVRFVDIIWVAYLEYNASLKLSDGSTNTTTADIRFAANRNSVFFELLEETLTSMFLHLVAGVASVFWVVRVHREARLSFYLDHKRNQR